ncbi:MAG: NUDIX hydrolase [Bacillota bacterium]
MSPLDRSPFPNPWRREETRTIYQRGPVRFREDACVHLERGNRHCFFVMEFLNWVNVVAVTGDQQVILVRQYRHGIQSQSLEIPGGTLDRADEDPAGAAARELLEETGYRAEVLEPLGRVAANPATQNNYCYFYLARGAVKVSEQHLDPAEDIRVELVPVAQVKQLIAQGEIVHSLGILGLLYALELLG